MTKVHMQAPASRREVVLGLAGLALGGFGKAEKAAAADEIQVYFGSGCFWHVQHEMIKAEQEILGRSQKDATSLAGYAGGLKTGPEGKVCYHNLMMDSDYGRLGHSEAVGLSIPADKFPEFAKEYFNTFYKGERIDPQDRGGEYRAVLGIPGGVSGPYFPIAKDAAEQNGMKLAEGKGNDPDTLKKRLVYVYDTAKFPFYRGEVYHQYHDDMIFKYGKEYNALRYENEASGKISSTGCPE